MNQPANNVNSSLLKNSSTGALNNGGPTIMFCQVRTVNESQYELRNGQRALDEEDERQ